MEEATIKKLKKLYYVTGIPIAVAERNSRFNILFPKVPNEPHYDRQPEYIKQKLINNKVGIQVPLMCQIMSSVYYCIFQYDKDVIIQLGPVATYGLNIQKYMARLKGHYSDEIIQHHIKLLRGAPEIDLNYFLNVVILALNLVCDNDITREQVVFDKSVERATPSVEPSINSRSHTLSKHIVFESEIYHLIEEGNEKRLDEVVTRNISLSKYSYLENDITKLRNVFIGYAAISCNHAMMGGAIKEDVQNAFREYMLELESYTTTEPFWELLPKLSKKLCHLVKLEKEKEYESLLIKKTTKYIEENIYKKITMKNLEDAVGSTRRTIYRHFMESKNMTPSEFITAKKLETVEKLLSTTELSIADISVLLGYSSQSHLNKVFLDKYEKTPAQYRKEIRRG